MFYTPGTCESDIRTLMKKDAPSNCLMIKLEEPSIQEFDPAAAINLWFNLKSHRRPGTGGSQKNKAGKIVIAA